MRCIKKYINHIKTKDIIQLFVVISLLSTFAYLLINLFTNGRYMVDLASGQNGQLGDYFGHVHYSQDLKSGLYNEYWCCFPPFVYLLYHLLYILSMSSNVDIIILVYMFIFIAIAYLYMLSLYDLGKYKYLFAISTLLSMPFMFAIWTANSVLFVLVIVGIAIKFYYKEGVYKEIALALIAVISGFKFYPAVFGFLPLIEKDYKSTLKLLVYGLLVFIVPFAFTGGINTFYKMCNVLMQTSNQRLSALTVSCWFSPLLKHFGLDFRFFAHIMQNLFLFFMLFMTIIAKKKCYKILFLTSITVSYLANSSTYCIIYLLIPFLFMYEEKEIDCINLILFLMIFSNYMIYSKNHNFFELNIRYSFFVHCIYVYNIYRVIKLNHIKPLRHIKK